jgi:hypothetical protein
MGLEAYRQANQGYRALKDPNIVLVVDDDPGILEGLQRLLWLHAYEPILFSSAEASKATPISKRWFASFSTSTWATDQASSWGITSKSQGYPSQSSTSPAIRTLLFARLRWTLGASHF